MLSIFVLGSHICLVIPLCNYRYIELWWAIGCVQAVTVLTNLQRGNVQTEESVLVPEQMNWHTRAAMGEITAQDLMQAAQNGSMGCKTEAVTVQVAQSCRMGRKTEVATVQVAQNRSYCAGRSEW